METVGAIVIVGVVFYGVYNLIKVYTDYLLRRRIVKSGHLEKAGIMDPPAEQDIQNRYPSLKWGLIAFLAGVGFIIIEILNYNNVIVWEDGSDTFLPFGIELVAIALGFLIYFFIVNARSMRNR
jgi:hypothetical protein